MQATDLPTFLRWLLTSVPGLAPSIVLHGHARLPEGLASAVARHLNEYDEDASGNWIAFTPGVLSQIAESETQRSLLGLVDPFHPGEEPDSADHMRETLVALAERGRSVLDGPVAMEACSGKAEVFRVWLGFPIEAVDPIHLILQPDHFSRHSLPAIIGDTFLEWAEARLAKMAG